MSAMEIFQFVREETLIVEEPSKICHVSREVKWFGYREKALG
jgi:hypothetical protein